MSYLDTSLSLVQKQYSHTNLSELIKQRALVWDKYFGQAVEKAKEEIFDIRTCSAQALDNYWGMLFKLGRVYTIGSTTYNLNDDQYREILRLRMFARNWDGSIVTLNAFLAEFFKDRGHVYAFDYQTMSYQVYITDFELEQWELDIFQNYDILPRCAGVQILVVYEIGDAFGFKDSDGEPWNSAPFRTYIRL